MTIERLMAGQGGSERAHIAGAAYEVIVDIHLSETTVEAIADRAGVDRATFHRHFKDVEDAYCEVLAAVRDEFLEAIVGAFESEEGWRNQIRAAAYAMLRFLREDEERARFTFVEVLSAGTRAQVLRDQAMEKLFDLIDLGRNELDDPDSISRATAEGVGGSIYNQLHMGIETGRLDLAEPFVPQLMYSVVLPYVGSDEALKELEIPPPGKVGE